MNILVIGGGSIGERHVRCFLTTGRTEVSLCDTSDEIRQRLQQSYPLTACYEDFESALASSDDVSAAVICTPAHLHVAMAIRLLQAGIPVLIEKPLSVSLDETPQLLELATVRNASMAYVYRQHPALRQMREAIRSGRFGRPVQLVSVSGQPFPLYRPAYREIYYNDRRTGGGAIQDALTHVFNAAEWLVGPITRLVADADHCLLEGVEVEDTAHVIARHGDLLASYTLNQHQCPNESALTVLCERGAVRMLGPAAQWQSCCEPGGAWRVEAEFALERDDLFVSQAAAFLDLLQGDGENRCPLDEGLQTLKVNLAALRSWEQRRWVTI